MTDFHVHLESDVATSFRCTRAAMSLDIDAKKKSVHDLVIENADVDTQYNVGLIVGASGSGKTTLAQSVYGTDCMRTLLSLEKPVIDQFPETMTYDECASALAARTELSCWTNGRPSSIEPSRVSCRIAYRNTRDESAHASSSARVITTSSTGSIRIG
jgi:energy-coupling factor transporter ATP-binding protein EcfA2